MSERRHTPGKWRAYLYPDTQRWGVESNPNGLIVCDCGPGGNAYAEGNAHLIASALDMRKTLRKLIREGCPTNWSDDDKSGLAWLEAERLSGEPLPDEDYNGERRAFLTRAANEET